MSDHHIDEDQATEIAVNFLQQHHSILKIERRTLEDDIWLIEVWVSAPINKKIIVKINAKTGYVLSWQ